MRSLTVPLIILNLQDDGFHLLVEIVVFGQRGYAVLDTGASRSVFDKTLLEKHLVHLESHEEAQAATIFSTSSTLQGCIPEIRIGQLHLKDYPVVGLDLQGISDTYQQLGHPPVIAIIGGDILMRFRAKIDYHKAIVRFYR